MATNLKLISEGKRTVNKLLLGESLRNVWWDIAIRGTSVSPNIAKITIPACGQIKSSLVLFSF